MELLESYCLHWNRPPAGIRALVPGLSLHRQDSHQSCLESEALGAGRERGSWRTGVHPQVFLFGKLAREEACQDRTSERKEARLSGQISVDKQQTLPYIASFQASLPQMWAREQLQQPGCSTLKILRPGQQKRVGSESVTHGDHQSALLFLIFCEVSWKRVTCLLPHPLPWATLKESLLPKIASSISLVPC